MNTEKDIEFEKIESLKWLPYVGSEFLNIPEENRIIVIGESHYHDNTEQSIEKNNRTNFTRRVLKELAIERFYWDTKMFPNFHKTIFRNDKFDTNIFWNLVCFYNFIQRPMITNKSRPSNQDFIDGWKTYFEIIKILKPKVCIFIGTSAANKLTKAIQNTEFSTKGVKWEDYINRAYAKTATIIDKDNNEIKLVFIRHTSQMFSWEKWNNYLLKVLPKEIEWLEEKVNTK